MGIPRPLLRSVLGLSFLAAPACAEKIGSGRPALPDEITARDVAVLPEGAGLFTRRIWFRSGRRCVRERMGADPLNVAQCPCGVFVIDREGQLSVGYRPLPDGPKQEVRSLLDEIAREAAGQSPRHYSAAAGALAGSTLTAENLNSGILP